MCSAWSAPESLPSPSTADASPFKSLPPAFSARCSARAAPKASPSRSLASRRINLAARAARSGVTSGRPSAPASLFLAPAPETDEIPEHATVFGRGEVGPREVHPRAAAIKHRLQPDCRHRPPEIFERAVFYAILEAADGDVVKSRVCLA